MDLAQLQAESAIDDGTIRRPPPRHIRQLNGGTEAATAAGPPIEALEIAVPTATYERQHGLVARAVKRTFDVVGALVLIAVLAPAWLVIALLIRADSPG